MKVGEMICFCHQVTKKEILKAIKEQKLRNVEEVGEVLRAGTNCGRCQPQIQAIFDEINRVDEGLFANDKQ